MSELSVLMIRVLFVLMKETQFIDPNTSIRLKIFAVVRVEFVASYQESNTDQNSMFYRSRFSILVISMRFSP